MKDKELEKVNGMVGKQEPSMEFLQQILIESIIKELAKGQIYENSIKYLETLNQLLNTVSWIIDRWHNPPVQVSEGSK